MNRKLLVAGLAVVLVACSGVEPIETKRGEGGVEINLITHVEGCRVYSIVRGGMARPIYTTICGPEGVTTSWYSDCGKNCEQPQMTAVKRD